MVRSSQVVRDAGTGHEARAVASLGEDSQFSRGGGTASRGDGYGDGYGDGDGYGYG